MNIAVARSVMGKCSVVAVSDAYRLAPWCDALASTDASWWRAHPEAMELKCRKFGGMVEHQKIEGVERVPEVNDLNSGLLGLMVAVRLGATKIFLCGFDMKDAGNHFFGRHPATLRSTNDRRMAQFHKQFERYQPKGVDIVNVTSDSALSCYRRGDLACELG